jgi:hypothetical protein
MTAVQKILIAVIFVGFVYYYCEYKPNQDRQESLAQQAVSDCPVDAYDYETPIITLVNFVIAHHICGRYVMMDHGNLDQYGNPKVLGYYIITQAQYDEMKKYKNGFFYVEAHEKLNDMPELQLNNK